MACPRCGGEQAEGEVFLRVEPLMVNLAPAPQWLVFAEPGREGRTLLQSPERKRASRCPACKTLTIEV